MLTFLHTLTTRIVNFWLDGVTNADHVDGAHRILESDQSIGLGLQFSKRTVDCFRMDSDSRVLNASRLFGNSSKML